MTFKSDTQKEKRKPGRPPNPPAEPARTVTGSQIARVATEPADVALGREIEAADALAKLDAETQASANLAALVVADQQVATMPPPDRDYGKCTPELTVKMVKLVIEGNFPDTVAVASGISMNTYYFWRERGQNGDEPYLTWWNAMVQACALSEIEAVRQIRQGDDRGAGFGPAKAALELISRRNKRWSPNVKIEVADQLTRLIDIVEKICPTDLYQKILEGLAEVDSETD